jgi:hypothetical protein
MSRISPKAMLLACVAACVITAGYAGETKRSVKLDKTQMLTLAENGSAQFEIVVPDNSSNVARYAAEELKTFLEKTTSGKISITATLTPGKTALLIGDNELTRKLGVDVKTLPRDGFIIKNIGNIIVIAGQDDPDKKPDEQFKSGIWGQLHERGTLFGAYDFLERFAGVRFYFPGELGTIVQKNNNLKVPAMDIVDCPDYTARSYSTYDGKWPGQKSNTDYYDKNKIACRYRMQTEYIPNCHGLRDLDYLERFGKTHPEYFAMMDNGARHCNPSLSFPGQLCYSSGIREEIYKDAEAFLTGKPVESRIPGKKVWPPSGYQKGYFNTMPQDGLYFCRCPECKKHFSSGDQATSEFLWDTTIDTALKLKQNNIPGYVTMMAYTFYAPVPKRDIPDNVLVMVAELGPWGEACVSTQQRDNQEIQDWVKKLGHKVWLWNYAGKYASLNIPGIPTSTPRAIGNYYKSLSPYITGAFLQSKTDLFTFNHLNYYVFSKVCWDNSADVDKLLNEYYSLMYGSAAVPMKKFFERIEYLWINKIIKKVMSTSEGPIVAPPSEYEIWEKIYSPQEIASLSTIFDQAEKLAAKDPDVLKRIKYMRNDFLDSLAKQAKTYADAKNDIAGLVFSVKDLPADKSINIDGKIDDSAWQSANEVSMTQFGSDKDAVKTTVKALRNKDYLYLAFDCKEPKLDQSIAVMRENDDKKTYKDSSVEIFLNPSGDRKNYYHLIVNMPGCLSDLKASKTGSESKNDWSWNSETIVKTGKNNDGWTAEIAIPLKNLEGLNTKSFPANFNRNRILSCGSSNYTWSPYLKNSFHEIDNFGILFFGDYKDTSIIDGRFAKATQTGKSFGKWNLPVTLKTEQSITLDASTSPEPGGKSIKLQNKGDESLALTQGLPALKPNTKYKLTFYVRIDDIKPVSPRGGVRVNIWDDKNCWFPDNSLTGTMPWTKQGFEFTTGPKTNDGKNNSYLKLLILKAEGSAWFDDIKLREIPAQ